MYNWVLEEQLAPTLIVYVVTALHHALQEWRKSGGEPPSGSSSRQAERKSAGWSFFFQFKK